MAEFSSDVDDFTEWIERLEQWFIANNIEHSERKRALFLSLIGSKGYKLIQSLAQNEPATKTLYEELTNLMKDHLQPRSQTRLQKGMFFTIAKEK